MGVVLPVHAEGVVLIVNQRHAERALRLSRKLPAWVAVVAVVVGLVACWWITLGTAAQTSVSRHFFYVPVVIAAVRFGAGAAAATGIAAGILAGPLVFTVEADPDPLAAVVRGAFFVLIGMVVASLGSVVRKSLVVQLRAVQRERELAEQRAALIQTVSHEFRTPLTIIRGAVESLARQPGAVDERFRQLLEPALRAESRLNELVDVVLAASDRVQQLQQHEQSPVDSRVLIEEATRGLQGADRVDVSVTPDTSQFVTAEAPLRLALTQVLDNALRFSEPHQPVQVEVRREADLLMIRVRDHGQGMDPSDYPKAFQPFSQLDPSTTRRHGGLGMGLFTARRLIEGVGGTVELSPAPGGGLQAELRLPQRREQDAMTRSRHRAGSSTTTPPER